MSKTIIKSGIIPRVSADPRDASRGDAGSDAIVAIRHDAQAEQESRAIVAAARVERPQPNLDSIVSQCKDNIENKNKFIDIFMNHFLNCDKIIPRTKNNTNDTDIKNYFLDLFHYSIDVLKTFPKYEEYTTNYKKYIADPDIIKILEGLSVTKNVPTDNLIQVPDIVKPQILNTQRTYNEKIGITTDLVAETDERTGDAFETSIYNYIDGFIGRDAELKTSKFIIVNHITNLDSGVSIAGVSIAGRSIAGVSIVLSSPAARSTEDGSAAGRSGGLAGRIGGPAGIDGGPAGIGPAGIGPAGIDSGTILFTHNGESFITHTDYTIVTHISNFQLSCFDELSKKNIKEGYVYGQFIEQPNSKINNIFLIFDDKPHKDMINEINKPMILIGYFFYNRNNDPINEILQTTHAKIIKCMNDNKLDLFTVYIVQNNSNPTTIKDIHPFTYIRENGKINIYITSVKQYINIDEREIIKNFNIAMKYLGK